MRFFLLIGLIGSLSATAQSIEDLKQKFPGEEAVMLNNSVQYKFSVKNGEPYVESRESQQLMYLTSHAAAYMGRYGFVHSGFHEIKEYEAWTQTPDNKKVKVSNFKTSSSQSAGVFYDDVKETMFDFPAIGLGASGHLKTYAVHKKPYLLSPHYFARPVAVVQSALTITFPKDMTVKYVLKGLDTSQIRMSQKSSRNETTYTFTVTDLPAEKKYGDAPGIAWYSPHVVFYIEKYKNEKGEEQRFLGNVDDLYKLNSSFLKDLNKVPGPNLTRIVDSLTKGIASTEEKARRIYSWVQQHIKYVAFEDGMEGFVPRDANLVCDRRFGDCKDMSSILTMMLNAAGVKAYHTWIGTRRLPYTYHETPLPIVDNHMICTIQLKPDEFIFLDGTDPTCVFGIPSGHLQDKEALVAISATEYRIVKVPSPPRETNRLTDSCFMQLTDKGLTGNITVDLDGYYAMGMYGTLSYLNSKDKEKFMKNRLSRGSNKFNVTSYDSVDLSDKNHITLKARFELQDYARKIGDEYYVNMNLQKLYEHEEIDYPRRKMPVENDFKFVAKFVSVLTIPEGYTVSYLPKAKSFKNEAWGFTMNYEQKGNTIIFTQVFEDDHLLIEPAHFKAWNEVLEHLFPQYKETISLTKK